MTKFAFEIPADYPFRVRYSDGTTTPIMKKAPSWPNILEAFHAALLLAEQHGAKPLDVECWGKSVGVPFDKLQHLAFQYSADKAGAVARAVKAVDKSFPAPWGETP